MYNNILQLEGSINDCGCEVDTVDHFNNIKIYPRLKSLLVKNYFRFFKVNLNHQCPFWPDDSKCAIRFCQVQNCEEQTIPPGLMEDGANHHYMKPTAYKVSTSFWFSFLLHHVVFLHMLGNVVHSFAINSVNYLSIHYFTFIIIN